MVLPLLIEFEGKRPKIGANVFLAPTAVVVGDNTSIWFGASVRGDLGPVRIGAGCSIQDNSSVHVFTESPTILHDDVTVGHNAVLEGCEVCKGSLVGMHATVLPFARVGEQTMIGAGSVVSEHAEIPDRVLAAGTPAKVLKALDGSALQWIERAAPDYRQLQNRYRAQGIG